MFKFVFYFAFMAIAVAKHVRPIATRPYPQNSKGNNNHQKLQLCTYSDITFKKCLHIVREAKNNAIPLQLECVRNSERDKCIQSVQTGTSDMVVLTGHGYKEARSAGLKPFIFAKENENSLYIAVVPRNITLIGIEEAPIYFDQAKHRAFHAATFFNLRMGHDICGFLNKSASLMPYIAIVDSNDYKPNSEEILICPNRLPDEFENYKECNIEAGLQRAVFIKSNSSLKREQDIRKIFDTILQHFANNTATTKDVKKSNFNFFDTFQNQDDIIFKKNTISFDLVPSYRNGVNEDVFNYLHCNNDDQPHDHRYLL